MKLHKLKTTGRSRHRDIYVNSELVIKLTSRTYELDSGLEEFTPIFLIDGTNYKVKKHLDQVAKILSEDPLPISESVFHKDQA